jgi:hypothetical protein
MGRDHSRGPCLSVLAFGRAMRLSGAGIQTRSFLQVQTSYDELAVGQR